ncbi:anhydro-N-acetylmuramic acid kinase [Seonamhaeicola sp. MEBiC1930]|uniref:anhydro-N-acetylmuramic acid kinase n=1 Tax=Seonamhaeicola sp. MEBiC01930 TaxID=2976768 RepID=UPI003253FC52
MIKSNYRIVGVMSGTSLDGIDLVHVDFQFEDTWEFKINSAETVAYPKEWKERLKGLISLNTEELHQTNSSYTSYLASVINDFIKKNKIKDLDAVCSHGHTALHQPEKQLTLQIGNLPQLASLIENKVVCDFRLQDVLLGGQGAPLVPIGDTLLFSEFDYCINLGGFANISTNINEERIAYDICPVNIVMNHYVKSVGLDYDDNGKLASKGEVNVTLLEKLNRLSFYKELPPKSLGLEWVYDNVFPLINTNESNLNNILRTFVEHIAIKISESISSKPNSSVLITGGGAYNSFLIDRIKELSKNEIGIPSQEIIEFKEALIFGFLGVLKLRNEINCLQSVTGASKNHSSGYVFMP